MLVTHRIPWEDAHAQQCSWSAQILELASANDVWIADRKSCTNEVLAGIEEKGALHIIRHHAKLPVVARKTMRVCGRIDTGPVFEQCVSIKSPDGNVIAARRITIKLDKPTRDADGEMSIASDLPIYVASASKVASSCRERWTIETTFQTMTPLLHGENDTLACPRAAPLGFATALFSYDVLSTVQATFRAQLGADRTQRLFSRKLGPDFAGRVTVGHEHGSLHDQQDSLSE